MTARSAAPPAAVGNGPWILHACGARSWATTACTRCGTAPWDEELGMTATFPGIEHARLGLPSEWGWQVTALPGQPDQVLCPPCAARESAGAACRAPWAAGRQP